MTKRRICLFIVMVLLASCLVGAQSQLPGTTSANWEAEIKQFEDADRKSPPPKGAVLFIGSSSIRLWKDLARDFPNVRVLNRGFGGSQIADSTYYADRIVTPYRPRFIVLYAGDNDLASGKTPSEVFEDYQQFVSKVGQRLPNVRIAYIAIKPSPLRWHLVSAIKAANGMIKQFTIGKKNLLFIDVFPGMLGADGKPRPELYAEDGLHLSEKGYAFWTKAVAPYLK
jgi:lysophospholipase L1-like esterase